VRHVGAALKRGAEERRGGGGACFDHGAFCEEI